VFSFLWAQEQSEISITGGLKYTSWVEQDSSILCCLTIKAPAVTPATREPLQVICLIDASNDMNGVAMQNGKVSVKTVMDCLSDKDLLSIVTFASNATPLFPMQPLTSSNRTAAVSSLTQIKSEQTRNFSEGLQKCAEQFNRFKSSQCLGRHLLILTNGNPGAGTPDKAQVLLLAESIVKKYNCSISTFGYDRYYDEDFLIALSQIGKGRAYFTEEDNVNDMSACFSKEARRISQTSLSGLTLEVVLWAGSTLGQVCGGFLENKKIIVGNMQGGVTQQVIFEIRGRPAKKKDIAVYVDYVKTARLTPAKTRLYIDCPVGTGTPAYNPAFAPLLIDYTTHTDIIKTIKTIDMANRSVREAYAVGFKETVKKLEQENGGLLSDYLKGKIEYYKNLQQELQNSALESNLMMKRVKYRLFDIVYGI
jgi:hypothetical protein